jgi:competence protein ComEC
VWSLTLDWFKEVHQSITKLLDIAVEDESARGFIEAVVLGDRNDMEKETLNDFTTAGVAHILAVSGFNVAIVALVIAQLLRLFGVYWHRPRIVVTMLGVLLYSGIVGFQPSVVRALLMIELYLVAKLMERKPDPLNILMSAAAIELLLRPSDLFDVSFQLSYAAVLGLVLIAPELKRLLIREPNVFVSRTETRGERLRRSLVESIALSLGASIASYPIIAAHFYRVSFIGLVANLPMIPLSALITALGFLLIPITAVSTWLGQLYGEAAAYLTNGLLLLTKLCAHVPLAAHAAAAPSWANLIFLLIAVIYCLRAKHLKQCMGRIGLVLVSYALLSLLPLPMTDSVLDKNEGKLQVLFFDVGQGDCILLHTPSNKSYFVDFGTMSLSGNAQIERTALPFLRAENSTNIEAGFISHMHRDHYGGATTLLEYCSFARMYTSGERVSDPLARALDADAREKHVALGVLSRGDTLQLDSNITLYVLHPDHHVLTSLLTSFGQHINSGSLAFRLVYRNTSFLFLGDVERTEEEEMLASYGDFLHSTVVKVAHHGSLTSSSRAFVAATHPEYAVISVGEHNRFGHPAPAIVKRWMTSGASVFRTDRDGATLLVSDGERVRKVEWR